MKMSNINSLARELFDGPVGNLAIFVVATGAVALAQQAERPITSVLIYLTGVVLIGARSGLQAGLLAAISASFVYNFFLSDPAFDFGVTSADEVVPLIAFNVSAVVSGAAAGRLQDSVRLANMAEAKNAFLLRISDGLQQALRPNDVARIAKNFLPLQGLVGLELYVERNGTLFRQKSEDEVAVDGITALMPDDTPLTDEATRYQVLPLIGADREVGIAKFVFHQSSKTTGELPDLKAIANLLGLAVDRCLLLEELAEGRAAQRSEELKNAILSSVSHDLRTPLTAIEAAASSLRSYGESLSAPQQQKMLLTIEQQCEQLNRYTADLLDMGRIQSGISNAGFYELDLLEIVGVVVGRIRREFPRQEINKGYDITEAIVFANAVMLEQAIYNVMENAVFHSKSGAPLQVRIYVEGDWAVLEITDYGPGIKPIDQPHIFDRFYKALNRSESGGSGLGLYIANGFVRAFGGEISLLSPVLASKGTTFFIRLPLCNSAPALEPEK